MYLLLIIASMAAVVRYLEEPQLERRFGEAYDSYQRHVPRWIPRPLPRPISAATRAKTR